MDLLTTHGAPLCKGRPGEGGHRIAHRCSDERVLYGSDFPHVIGDMAGCLARERARSGVARPGARCEHPRHLPALIRPPASRTSMNAPAAARAGQLRQTLAEGRFAITAELSPPMSTDASAMLERARVLGRARRGLSLPLSPCQLATRAQTGRAAASRGIVARPAGARHVLARPGLFQRRGRHPLDRGARGRFGQQMRPFRPAGRNGSGGHDGLIHCDASAGRASRLRSRTH